MQIHSRKMNIAQCVNFEELARSTDDFNGAQCKAVCVEALIVQPRYVSTVGLNIHKFHFHKFSAAQTYCPKFN
ncbi:26S protease regulatory subunit 6A-B [Portunus trituberculatus]|uniref:26S protease regulatory subunit 6A-B n=1 Tax=Portunus trituberculatus TaxID=210409 RepID=A0A5B7IT42_PORTR|nr:26S protease regulatory subunit 6A-B [Portunus trituberculatus]